MGQEERESSREVDRKRSQSNFLNHLLRRKGRKAALSLAIVKQETQLVHNRMFKSHFNGQEVAESYSHCLNTRQF